MKDERTKTNMKNGKKKPDKKNKQLPSPHRMRGILKGEGEFAFSKPEPKVMIKTDCPHGKVECPPARDEDGAPTRRNAIAAFFHCKQCLKELPIGESPRTYGSVEVGFTAIGLQVYCKRHEINVCHIDFEGQKHPANLNP